jgi:hypothetical protein
MPTKAKARPAAPCPKCGGTGTAPLTGKYLATWELLRRQARPANGAELARQAGCGATAMCNRLRALAAKGLAAGERHGREVLWTARENHGNSC